MPKNVLVIAHRGACAEFPENTMPAFEAAKDQQADMIELDIQWTKDGIPVVFHDHNVDRCTDGKGKPGDFLLKELKKLDAGSWFAPQFTGVKIPVLQEVLQWAEGTIALNIEIKTRAGSPYLREGIKECCRLVEQYNMSRHVLFSSFDLRAVQRVKQLAPQMPVALLYSAKLGSARWLLDRCKIDAFHCSRRQLPAHLPFLKKWAIPTSVYTVNRPWVMKKLVMMGVYGIITDKPLLLREVLKGVNRPKEP